MDQQIEKIDSTSPIPDTKADGKMVLRTENLVKKYRQRTVVNHVSIDVTQGEIVGLLGPNGAGKTTTFYMTTGLITPNEGQIFLNDKNITKYPVYKRAQNGIKTYAPKPISKRQNHKYHPHASCNSTFSTLHNIALHKTTQTTHKIIPAIFTLPSRLRRGCRQWFR